MKCEVSFIVPYLGRLSCVTAGDNSGGAAWAVDVFSSYATAAKRLECSCFTIGGKKKKKERIREEEKKKVRGRRTSSYFFFFI